MTQDYRVPRLGVGLDNYYRLTTLDQRLAATKAYGGIEHTLVTALNVSAKIFEQYGFNLDKTMQQAEEVCYDYLYENLSYDSFDVVDEPEDVILAVTQAIGDVYPVILTYAQRGIYHGHDLEWVKDALLLTEWGVVSNTDEGDDEWDEIQVIVTCPKQWRFYG